MPAQEFHSVMTSAAEIVAADGTRLAGIVHEAAVPARGVALIVAAMAVKQQFYAALATGSPRVAGTPSRSYRHGRLGAGSLKDSRQMSNVVAPDTAAALVLHASAPAAAIDLDCYSLGGQILAMTPGNESLAAASPWRRRRVLRENAYPLRRYSWWLWHVIRRWRPPFSGTFRAVGCAWSATCRKA
jgi:predicted alpha/beta hydrolase